MSNDLKLVRADVIEVAESADLDNVAAASKAGNAAIAVVGGVVYVADEDGLLGPAGKPGAPVAAGATKTLTNAQHANKTILLDTVTGSVVTLPAATGSGDKFRFAVSVVPTSNSHKIQVANANDSFVGILGVLTDGSNAVIAFAPTAGDDTITLNRSTTGGTIKGEYIEIEDIAENVFAVRGFIAASGTEATPFSAAVS